MSYSKYFKTYRNIIASHYIDDGFGKIFNIIFYNKSGYFKNDSVYNNKLELNESLNNIRKSIVVLYSKADLDKKNYILQLWKRYKKHIYNTIRIKTDSLLGLKFDDLIVTTYFISKSNPQAGSLSHANDPNSLVHEYSKNDDKLTSILFNSIKKHNQHLSYFMMG